MSGFARLVLSLCDLAEAEGRQFRKNIKATGAGCLLISLGILFIGAALAFCVAALYKFLAELLHPSIVFIVLALACAVIAAIILWSARKCVPKKATTKKK